MLFRSLEALGLTSMSRLELLAELERKGTSLEAGSIARPWTVARVRAACRPSIAISTLEAQLRAHIHEESDRSGEGTARTTIVDVGACSRPPVVFLTGATGFLGRALLEHWREEGRQSAMLRLPIELAGLASGAAEVSAVAHIVTG